MGGNTSTFRYLPFPTRYYYWQAQHTCHSKARLAPAASGAIDERYHVSHLGSHRRWLRMAGSVAFAIVGNLARGVMDKIF